MTVNVIKANVVQQMDYYPFGLMWEAQDATQTNNLLWHHGKELQEGEFLQQGVSFDLEDFGARMYDPVVARWWSVDPLAASRTWVNPFNFVQNNPITRVDPTGKLDDWVQNDETGEYEWKNEVTSVETTPQGYQYIGKNDSDIIRDIYGTTSADESTVDVGLVRAEDFDNPHSAKGVAFMNAVATTKIHINLIADVKYTINIDGSITRKFNGVLVTASIISNISPIYPGVSYSLKTETITINGKQMMAYNGSRGPVLMPSPGVGGVPNKLYDAFISSSSLNHKSPNSINLAFKGLYQTGANSYLGFPSVIGLFGNPNYTELSIGITH